jgi:hypothetical protein
MKHRENLLRRTVCFLVLFYRQRRDSAMAKWQKSTRKNSQKWYSAFVAFIQKLDIYSNNDKRKGLLC